MNLLNDPTDFNHNFKGTWDRTSPWEKKNLKKTLTLKNAVFFKGYLYLRILSQLTVCSQNLVLF